MTFAGWRRTLFGTGVVLAVVIAVSALVARPRPRTLTFENFSRISIGMDRAHVVALLGPPVDDSSGPTILDAIHAVIRDPTGDSPPYVISGSVFVVGGKDAQWSDDATQISVTFTSTGEVALASYYPAYRQEQTLLDNLVWRARRQWRRWFP
jgi:hypothetical protein